MQLSHIDFAEIKNNPEYYFQRIYEENGVKARAAAYCFGPYLCKRLILHELDNEFGFIRLQQMGIWQRKNEVMHCIFIISIAYQTLYNSKFSHYEKIKRLTELLYYCTDIGLSCMTNRLREIIIKFNNSIGPSYNPTIEAVREIDPSTPTYVANPESMLIRKNDIENKLIESDFDVAIEFLEDNLNDCFSWFPIQLIERAEDFTIDDGIDFISDNMIKLALLSWNSNPEVQYYLYSHMYYKMILSITEGKDTHRATCARYWNSFITYLPSKENSVVVESLLHNFHVSDNTSYLQPVEDNLSKILI